MLSSKDRLDSANIPRETWKQRLQNFRHDSHSFSILSPSSSWTMLKSAQCTEMIWKPSHIPQTSFSISRERKLIIALSANSSEATSRNTCLTSQIKLSMYNRESKKKRAHLQKLLKRRRLLTSLRNISSQRLCTLLNNLPLPSYCQSSILRQRSRWSIKRLNTLASETSNICRA